MSCPQDEAARRRAARLIAVSRDQFGGIVAAAAAFGLSEDERVAALEFLRIRATDLEQSAGDERRGG